MEKWFWETNDYDENEIPLLIIQLHLRYTQGGVNVTLEEELESNNS